MISLQRQVEEGLLVDQIILNNLIEEFCYKCIRANSSIYPGHFKGIFVFNTEIKPEGLISCVAYRIYQKEDLALILLNLLSDEFGEVYNVFAYKQNEDSEVIEVEVPFDVKDVLDYLAAKAAIKVL